MGYINYSNIHHRFRISCFFGVGLLVLIFVGCDEGSYSSKGESGSVEFQIQSVDGDGVGTDPSATIKYLGGGGQEIIGGSVTLPCRQTAITDVSVVLYNDQNVALASDSWKFGDGGGGIGSIPPGSNYTIVGFGINNPDCGIIYRNEKGVDIIADQTTNVGFIDIDQYSFVPFPSDSAIEWPPVQGATSYRVQITQIDDSSFGHPVVDEIVLETAINALLTEGSYYWRVYAQDVYGKP